MATPRERRARLVLVGCIVLAVVAVLASLALGARPIAVTEVFRALFAPEAGNNDHTVVLTQRVPRTVIGLIAGAALALAGTLMQGITRNPLADPGILGVNAGASVAVLFAVIVFGVTSPTGFVWYAFVGAAVAAVAVGVIGSTGADGSNPIKLALTGAAITAGLSAVTAFILTTSNRAFDVYRFWSVGGLTSRDLDAVLLVLIPFAIGAVIALTSGRGLDLIALGDETAAGLGANLARTRILGIVATVLLCGSATAIAGPIVFVGLVVPHALRALVGSGYRPLLAAAPFAGAFVLLTGDVIGRFVAPPGELSAGLVVSFAGAPLLIALVLQRKKVSL